MKLIKNFTALLIIASVFAFAFTVPLGWHIAGNQPDKYEMGTDSVSGINGSNAATIKSIAKKIDGFGTLMQNSNPGFYSGKRVRMSGFLKSSDVADWAGFWFRVDQADTKPSLAFDNMQHRAIKGTTDWKKYSIILDVPTNASNLAYGALLSGTGQIWFDEIKFEIVSDTVPVTDMLKQGPLNLDFEKH